MDVGGDWYDVIDVDVDDYGVVVGDVVGHDVRAAIGMSQLRNALAALSHARRDPAAVLERLDDYASHTPGLLGATVFYGRLQPLTGVLSYSTAGHPPPLVVRADGNTSFLSGGRAAPVGVTGPRHSAASTLEPGDLLLCYTDGLIERRDEPVTDGMQRLTRTVREQAPGVSLNDLADHLLVGLRPAEGVDDIALLGLRRMA